jgi:hypothetical protein
MRLKRPQPVHVYGDERAERPSLIRTSHKLEFFARCHRCEKEDTFVVEVPVLLAGRGSTAQLISSIFVFGPWRGGAKHFTGDKWLKLAKVGMER